MKLCVDVQRVSCASEAPDESELVHWASAAAAAVTSSPWETAELSLRVVDEAEGIELNHAYRGGSGATNVLSFPFEAGERTTPPLLGDVVVCAPVVRREAREQGKSLRAHFAHMVVHGVLHLLGYSHDDDAEAAVMEDLERHVLAGVGFDDPYAMERDGAA